MSSSRGRNDGFIPSMRRESTGVVSIRVGSTWRGVRGVPGEYDFFIGHDNLLEGVIP